MGTFWRLQYLFPAALIAICVLAHGNRVAIGSATSEPNKKNTDCATIQGAINNLPPTGGAVKLRAVTYMCAAPIVIDRDNVCLRGQGPATVLRLADGANSPVLVLGQTLPIPAVVRRNICVSDLAIDGNRLTQPDECWGGPCSPTNPIRNNGITLRRVADVRIEGVTVFSARSGGLVSELTSRRLTVRDYTSFDNHFDGLAGYETEESTFAGINVFNNLAAGLSFDIRFNNNHVSDATITGNGTVGIFMRDSQDNTFSNLQIRDNSQHGIFLAQVDTDPTKPAAGNIFQGMVVAGSGGAGLRVNDASCVNNLVVGAQFIENAGGCISEATPGLVQAFGTICR